MAPKVSVILPVFNSIDYVREAIQSVRDQTIDPGAVEIIAIDDGSTDGSDAVLAELAAEDPRLTVLTQENSGTAGGGRNPGISRATGEFIFFLDSDDRLTHDALRRMVEVAESEGSDVVLGKMSSTDKRHAPASMFKRTVLDAHLLRDNVFNTLGPTKLIRRDLIERLGLRFPEDQKVGEDQPFMAAVYLNARKVSVLADMDYYIIRHRTDGSNLTQSKQNALSHLTIAVRLAQAIETHTEPGEFRDGLLRRPFSWPMKRVLDARWPKLTRKKQAHLAETFRAEIAHLYGHGVRRLISAEHRVALDLLAAEDLDAVTAYISELTSGVPARTVWGDGEFRRQLPEEIAHLVPEEDRTVATPKIHCRLEDLRVESARVTVSATVRIPDLEGAPDSLAIRARKRNSALVEDFTTTFEDLAAGARSFLVTAEHDGLGRGVWDLYVVARFDDFEKEIRFGADRARAIEPEGVSNLQDDPEPQDSVIAYFAKGPGNLSIDRGAVLHRQIAKARAIGLTVDENGRAVMLVQTTSRPSLKDEYFGYVEGVPQFGGRHLLPSVQLGDRLIGLRLPLTAEMIGAKLSVISVLDGARAPLPATGTEFWPARAVGFGLALGEDGSLAVTTPSESGRDRLPLPRLDSKIPGARWRAARRRVRAKVKNAPVVGPILTRAFRTARRWRS